MGEENKMEDLQSKIEFIADHYGYDKQSRQATEEMGECIAAINKLCRYWSSRERDKCLHELVAELADVDVMIRQLVYLLDCGDEKDKIMSEKIDRQIRRIYDK